VTVSWVDSTSSQIANYKSLKVIRWMIIIALLCVLAVFFPTILMMSQLSAAIYDLAIVVYILFTVPLSYIFGCQLLNRIEQIEDKLRTNLSKLRTMTRVMFIGNGVMIVIGITLILFSFIPGAFTDPWPYFWWEIGFRIEEIVLATSFAVASHPVVIMDGISWHHFLEIVFSKQETYSFAHLQEN